jgi:Na+/citrate or Na+/malate symporter
VTTWGLAALRGSDFPKTFFLQLAPTMAGGLTAGALPLAAGYADQWGRGQGEMLAQMLPALFVANLAAIVGAGIIGMIHPVGAAGNGGATASDVESFGTADVGLAVVAIIALHVFGMVIAAVLVLSITGYLVSDWTGLNPADAATITLSRMAMGGTGAVALLSAGGRLPLLPFALLITRLGGALTVLIALQAAAVIQP